MMHGAPDYLIGTCRRYRSTVGSAILRPRSKPRVSRGFRCLGTRKAVRCFGAYVVRHPERVSRLIIYGGYALGGYRRSPEEREQRKAMATLMRTGWGTGSPDVPAVVYLAHDAGCHEGSGRRH